MSTRYPDRHPSDALRILERIAGDSSAMQDAFEEAGVQSQAAQLVYDIRTAAGLTQKELAQRAGTTQSVIARLEDADYRGHTLRMLRRIGSALGYEVEVRFRPVDQPAAKGKSSPAASKSRKPASRKREAVPAPVARKPAARSAKTR